MGAHYLPSYLSLSSWYSPSQCYLQLQPPSRPLQVRLAGVSSPSPAAPRAGRGGGEQGPGTDAEAPPPPARVEFLGMNARPSFHYGEHLGCGPGFTVINLALGVLSLKISSLPYGVARLLPSMSQCPHVHWIHGSLQGTLGTSPGIVGSVGLDKRRMTRIQHYSIIQNGLSALKILWTPPPPTCSFIPPSPPAPGNLPSFHGLDLSASSRMSYHVGRSETPWGCVWVGGTVSIHTHIGSQVTRFTYRSQSGVGGCAASSAGWGMVGLCPRSQVSRRQTAGQQSTCVS